MRHTFLHTFLQMFLLVTGTLEAHVSMDDLLKRQAQWLTEVRSCMTTYDFDSSPKSSINGVVSSMNRTKIAPYAVGERHASCG